MVTLQTDTDSRRTQEIGATSLEAESQANESATVGVACHEVFDKDTLTPASQSISSHTIEPASLAELAPLTDSFWSKILSWWQNPPVSHSSSLEPVVVSQVEPISPIPALEPPAETMHFPFTPEKSKSTHKLTDSQIVEGLSLMSALTLDAILFIIFQAQLKLEEENAKTAEGTFSKYQEFKQFQEKILREVKDVLAKDEKVLNFFKKAQNLTVAASFLCGMIAAATTFGLFSAAPAAVIVVASILGTAGPIVIASLTALTTGIKSYYKIRFNECQAKHEIFSHQDSHYKDCVDGAYDKLTAIADSDEVFKGRFAQMIQRNKKMKRLVLEKS